MPGALSLWFKGQSPWRPVQALSRTHAKLLALLFPIMKDPVASSLGFEARAALTSWSQSVRRVIPPTNPMVRSVFPLLVFFLAMIFSGILEKTPLLNGLKILTILGGLALIVVVLGGRLQVILNDPIGRSMALFTVWFFVCVPFAFWPGGSVQLLEDYWSKSALSFFLVAGCILTIKQSKTIFETIGYSVGLLAIMALVLRGVDNTGRLGLLGTRYENANDFAWTLILGFCFLAFLIVRGSRSQKLIALFLSATILLALVKTGSRGGMIGLGMLGLVGFFQSSRAVRIKLAFAIPVLLALLYAVAPPELRGRYTTLFGSGEDYTGRYLEGEERLKAAATGSADARWRLLKDSIYMTLRHPVFGVGPGDFMPAQNELAIARGEWRGEWRVTHNTYTQISSEMGIPGLMIYLVLLYRCFKSLNSIVRSRYPGVDWEDLRALAKSLRASFVVIMTTAFFDSYGYDTNIPILAGLACALSLIAQRQRLLLTAPPQVTLTAAVLAEPVLDPAWMRFQ
jgi:O-antigen ligase